MALGQYHLFLVMSAALLLLNGVSVAATPEEKILGGWTPIKNVNDLHVQYLGKWAVTSHNLSGKSLKFKRVISGETQMVNGINYRLVIEALNGNNMGKYQAVVFEKIRIRSFNPLLG